MVLAAGMLGVPASKEDALLIAAVPAGGYILVKIGGMALKRAVFLLRGARNADEMVTSARRLEFSVHVQRVEDASALRTAVASENEALSANFEEVVDSLPAPVISRRNREVRSQASPAVEIQSLRNVEVRSQASKSTVVEMSHRPRLSQPPKMSSQGSIKPTYKLGASDGGPGRWEWAPVRPQGSPYQQQVTGAPAGTEYAVPAPTPSGKVLFDGYNGALLDAKDWEKWPPADTHF
jgi:hypothetical protein